MATPPTFPAADDLVIGTGTRSFAGVATQAGDYLLVQVVVENDDLTGTSSNHAAPTTTGLTFNLHVDSGGTGGGGTGHTRGFFWSAQDATGSGSRVVQVNPADATQNYRARVTVVRGTNGAGASAATRGAQTVSLARSDNSAVFMNVGDWTAAALGSSTWTPGGSTVASQQHTSCTVYIGRWDDSGAAGTAATGLATPTVSAPTVVVLEMLGTAGAGGPDPGAAAYRPAYLAMPGRGLVPIQKLARSRPVATEVSTAQSATGSGAPSARAHTAADTSKAATAVAATGAHATTADTGAKQTTGTAAPAARNATAATSRKQAAATGAPAVHATTGDTTGRGGQGSGAATAHVAVAATGGRGTPNGPAAATQRVAVAATGSKQAAGTAAATQHSADTATGSKQATGAGAATARPLSRATTAPSGSGAATGRSVTTAAGKSSNAGAGRSSPHPATTSTGKAATSGAARAAMHPVTAATSGRVGAGAARTVQRAVTAAAGFAPPPYQPILVGLDNSATTTGAVDNSATTTGAVDTAALAVTGLLG